MDRVRAIDLFRWICVPLVSVVGGSAVQHLGGIVVRFVRSGWGAESGSQIPLLLQLCVYAIVATAFVLLGGFTAPRYRLQTAFVIAIVGILLSLFKHILLQTHPGIVNYLHLFAEAMGSLVAVVLMFRMKKRSA